MPYTYHTDDDRKAMLDALGIKAEDELLKVIPEKHRVRGLLPIDQGRTEPETIRKLFALAERNAPAARLVSFLGGGIYDHIVPSVVRTSPAGRSSPPPTRPTRPRSARARCR